MPLEGFGRHCVAYAAPSLWNAHPHLLNVPLLSTPSKQPEDMFNISLFNMAYPSIHWLLFCTSILFVTLFFSSNRRFWARWLTVTLWLSLLLMQCLTVISQGPILRYKQWNSQSSRYSQSCYFSIKLFVLMLSQEKDDYVWTMRFSTTSQPTNHCRTTHTSGHDPCAWCNVCVIRTAGLSTITQTQLHVSCCRLLAVWL